jgi:hypothetical protein
MQSVVGESFETLLIAIGLSLPIAVWVIAIIHWMLDGSVEVAHGFVGIGIALALATLILMSENPVVRAALFVSVLTTLVVVPFADGQLMRRVSKQLDTDALERAHEAFATNPANASARFEIARWLEAFGLVGHAIAIAEEAKNALPDDRDPVSNRSIQDMFAPEIRRLADWKARATVADFRRAPCPRCKAMNPPGAIACTRCGGPYLLDLARSQSVRSRFVGRLIIAWAIASVVFAAVPLIALRFGFGIAIAAAAVLIAGAGFAFYRMFADRPIA